MVFHNFRLSNLMECSFIELIPCILMMIHSILKLLLLFYIVFTKQFETNAKRKWRKSEHVSARRVGCVRESRRERVRKFSDNMAVFNVVCPLEKSIWKCTSPLQLIHLSQKTSTQCWEMWHRRCFVYVKWHNAPRWKCVCHFRCTWLLIK